MTDFNTTIKFNSSPSNFKDNSNGVVIVPKATSRDNTLKLLKQLHPQSFEEFESQARSKLSNSKKNSGSEALCISLSSGLVIWVIAIDYSDSINTLQSLFSKNLKKDFSKSSIWYAHLSKLKKSFQLTLAQDLITFAETTNWKPKSFKKKSSKTPVNLELNIYTHLTPKENKNTLLYGKSLGGSINLARELSMLPGNQLTPKSYRETIQKRSIKKYKTNFIGDSELKKKKAGAFLAVTSALKKNEGGILHLTQTKKPSRTKGKLCIVGKGICFDTGGYNIKSGKYMMDMHKDMYGSALALALFETLVSLNLPIEVHAYLALAENMISESGYKPNDVVIASNGLSIEIVDTDAEGRMVLADTLAIATQKSPNLVLNYATLTGSAIAAVGTERSAVFASHQKIEPLFRTATDKSGERVWSFPHGEEYSNALKSEIADLLQCSPKSGPDHIHAATFLSNFIHDDSDWVHMDLSAETHSGGLGLITTETTGFGVKWSLEFVKQYFKVK